MVLVKQHVFGSTQEVLIAGPISNIAVDEKDRVYILGYMPGQLGIYVFDSDGSFITTIGASGKGPGEFLIASSMHIKDSILYIIDRMQKKVAAFSLKIFDLLYEIIIDTDNTENDETLAMLTPQEAIPIDEEGTLIIGFESNVLSNENQEILFYKLRRDGTLMPPEILELKSHHIYQTGMKKTESGVLIPFTIPFTRSSLTAITENGRMYTAWSEYFLIKEYDRNGNYKKAFYYPYQKSSLSLSDLEIDKNKREIVNESQVPESWPVLQAMFADDQNRLWVS